MYLHQYDYIFGIGTVFAMLDAYNNGASKYTIHHLLCNCSLPISLDSSADTRTSPLQMM